MTADFRKILAKDKVDDADRERATAILKYINGLYTVYTNLFLYDRNGRVLAVSNSGDARIVGSTLNDSWVEATLALPGTQAYSVSPFDETPLYGGRPTYIYGAVVTDMQTGAACGGIGIVFDSAPQFQSMLRDSLPQDEQGAPQTGHLGFFVDRKGRIISSSQDDHKPGQKLSVPTEYVQINEGAGLSGIVDCGGKLYAIGSRVSSGYREYKRGDGYQNDVIAIAMTPLAKTRSVQDSVKNAQRFDCNRVASTSADAVEVATFIVGQRSFGIRTDATRGAISVEGLTPIPGAHALLAGKIAYEGKAVPDILFCLESWLSIDLTDFQFHLIINPHDPTC